VAFVDSEYSFNDVVMGRLLGAFPGVDFVGHGLVKFCHDVVEPA